MQDNKEQIGDFLTQVSEAEEAKRKAEEEENKRILETPFEELTLEELEKRKELELEPIEEELLKWKEEEFKKIPENTNSFVRKFLEEAINKRYEKLSDEKMKVIDEKFEPYENVANAGFYDLFTIADTIEDSDVKGVINIMLELSMNGEGNIFEQTNYNTSLVFIPDAEAARDFYEQYVAQPNRIADLNELLQGVELQIDMLPLEFATGAFVFEMPGAIQTIKAYADTLKNEYYLTDMLEEGSYYAKYDLSYTVSGFGSTTNRYTLLCEVDKDGNMTKPPHLYVYKSAEQNTPVVGPGVTENQKTYTDPSYYEYGK